MINWCSFSQKKRDIRRKKISGRINTKEKLNWSTWNQFYNIHILKLEYKNRLQAHKKYFSSWEMKRDLDNFYNRPDHLRHHKETQALDGASFSPNTLLVWLFTLWNEEQRGGKLNAFEKHKQRQGQQHFALDRVSRRQWRVVKLVSSAGSKKFF